MATVDPVSYRAANESAKQQMAFQERMSNTAHQREVADLKAAGLNPVLSAHTQGASTPTGAEGYVGDANARLFDMAQQLVDSASKSSSGSAKSMAVIANKMIDLNKDLVDSKKKSSSPDWSKMSDSHDLVHQIREDLDGLPPLERTFFMKNWETARKILYSDDPKSTLQRQANDLVSAVDRALPVAYSSADEAVRKFKKGVRDVQRTIKTSIRNSAKKAIYKAGSYGSLGSNWYS